MKRVILFDGVCNLCNRSVQFVIRRDPQKKFRFAPLQSEAAITLLHECGTDPDAVPDSMILVEGDKIHFFSDAVLRIGRDLSLPWSFLATVGLIVPRFIRNPLYRFIARHRIRWFGQRDECIVPTPENEDRFL